MQKFQAVSHNAEVLGPEEILEALLVESGVAGDLPTDENRLLDYLGLEQLSFDFMSELPFVNQEQSKDLQLRAALHLNERVVATQSGLGEKRTRFSIFHEVAHCVLPEHLGKLFLDTDQTLSWWVKARLEREANQFAADLLFQGSKFTDDAVQCPLSIKTVLDLAPRYGASYEAALRRFAEKHVVPCAVVVFDKTSIGGDDSFVEDDLYRIQYTITSPQFRKLFFAALQVTDGTCSGADLFGAAAWRIGNVVEKELVVSSQGKQKWRFETELFSNGYKIFQFIQRQINSATK